MDQDKHSTTEHKKSDLPHKPHHFATKKVILLGIVFLLVALLSLLGTYYAMQKEKTIQQTDKMLPITPTATPSEEQVFCTMDAKVCPDGSSVGRVPPSCEFAPCPGN